MRLASNSLLNRKFRVSKSPTFHLLNVSTHQKTVEAHTLSLFKSCWKQHSNLAFEFQVVAYIHKLIITNGHKGNKLTFHFIRLLAVTHKYHLSFKTILKLPFKTYSNKNYWTLKNKVERVRFSSIRQKFRIKNFFLEEKYKANSAVVHVKLTLWSIFKAVGFVALLFVIEHFVTEFWQSHNSLFPEWLIRFQELLPKPTYPDDRDAIVELISVIASVTGVILALFYPILATIASTAYAKVHASIRNLLLYEKETQAYLRRLTYLTACAIAI